MSAGRETGFYKTKAWQKCRDEYFRKVGGLCERCKAKGLIVPAEIIHHKIHIDETNIKDPSITLNPNNLCALCAKCHGEEHSKIRRRYVIGDDGSVITR